MKGLNLISVIRPRAYEEYGEFVERTKKDGATFIIDSDNFSKYTYRDIIREYPPAKLALDCSGGSLTADISRFLELVYILVFTKFLKKEYLDFFDLFVFIC